MKRPSLLTVIKAFLVGIFICTLSVGLATAQQRGVTFKQAAPPQKPPVVRETPKEAPKEAVASSAPTEKVTAGATGQSAPKPGPQIKISPVRITLGGAQNNRKTQPSGIQISAQDAAKLQKIIDLFNLGQNNRR